MCFFSFSFPFRSFLFLSLSLYHYLPPSLSLSNPSYLFTCVLFVFYVWYVVFCVVFLCFCVCVCGMRCAVFFVVFLCGMWALGFVVDGASLYHSLPLSLISSLYSPSLFLFLSLSITHTGELLRCGCGPRRTAADDHKVHANPCRARRCLSAEEGMIHTHYTHIHTPHT